MPSRAIEVEPFGQPLESTERRQRYFRHNRCHRSKSSPGVATLARRSPVSVYDQRHRWKPDVAECPIAYESPPRAFHHSSFRELQRSPEARLPFGLENPD